MDFKRNKFDVPATVLTIEYDPNRTCRIALIEYKDGEKSYILAPNGLQVGMKVESGQKVAPKVGNAMPLKNVPWVPPFTTLKSVRVPAARLPVQPVSRPSFPTVKQVMR